MLNNRGSLNEDTKGVTWVVPRLCQLPHQPSYKSNGQFLSLASFSLTLEIKQSKSYGIIIYGIWYNSF